MSPRGPDLYDRPPNREEHLPIASSALAFWLVIIVIAGLTALIGVLF